MHPSASRPLHKLFSLFSLSDLGQMAVIFSALTLSLDYIISLSFSTHNLSFSTVNLVCIYLIYLCDLISICPVNSRLYEGSDFSPHHYHPKHRSVLRLYLAYTGHTKHSCWMSEGLRIEYFVLQEKSPWVGNTAKSHWTRKGRSV